MFSLDQINHRESHDEDERGIVEERILGLTSPAPTPPDPVDDGGHFVLGRLNLSPTWC